MRGIKEEVLKCEECGLCKGRINPVVGEGNLKAKIMFIGEAPGANEDETGRPFCGKAGKILDELLSKAGISREDIYISNILKCRPPRNRNPNQEEIKSCGSYLDRQITFINPKVICCLGNFSTAYIMKKFNLENRVKGISQIHGQVFIYKSTSGTLRIIPLYHPAVVTYNAKMFNVLEKDFCMLKNLPE